MEAAQQLTFALVIIVSLALYFQRRRRSTARVLRQPTIKIGDAAIARQMLIDKADAFSNRPATPFPVPIVTAGRRRRRPSHGLTSVPYGAHWRALRSSFNAAVLQPWRQGHLAPLLQDAVDSLVAGLLTRGAGEVVVLRDSLSTVMFTLFTRMCFGDGVDPLHVRSIARMKREFVAAIGEARVFARGSGMAKLWYWRQWRRFLAFRGQQAALIIPLIEERRRQRSGGEHRDNGGTTRQLYVDALIDHRTIPHENDPAGAKPKRALTDDEMVTLIVEFFGGAESTGSVLEWALAHLITQSEVQAKLRHELASGDDHGRDNTDDGSVSDKRPDGGSTYLHAVVLETLRLHPPFPLVMREVHSEGTVVGTATVPAGGMRVQFMLGDIGKDKKFWTDPDEFRPERFLPGGEGEDVGLVPAGSKEIRMMPFGAGQRACPGAAMGVQFIKGFLAALVRQFEWVAPPVAVADKDSVDGCGVDMTDLYGFITVMKSPLRAHITPCA